MGKISRKLTKIAAKLGGVQEEKGKEAAVNSFLAYVTYALYDKHRIKRLKKFPPKLVENRILFETNDDFTDNSRALFDYMLEKGYQEKYELIWLVHQPEKYKEFETKNVRFVQNFKKDSGVRRAEAYECALTSKYIFYTQAFNWIGMSRRGQVFVNLWHGCGYKANKNNRKVFFDYCLVPGDIFIETKKEFFGCSSKKLLPIGYPRYDMMLAGSDKARAYRERLLSETKSTHLVLWMPTYRHATSQRLNEETLNNEFNIPIVDDREKLLRLNDFCREQGILLVIKKHYLQIPYDFGENVLTNIIYVENGDLDREGVQLYQFINCSDALISDYSSVAIDYLLLDRPLAFTLDDYDAYTQSRGWVFEDPLEYMPGAHVYSMEEFCAFLLDVKEGRDDYGEKRAKVRAKTHNVCENYCQRVLDYFGI
ncbi:MAG: CDP-glycerol glycerophosphotransferase family protein [Eubacteriales bacterium]|nr:CDP-glycerol glycerophosphotransferase family protein [Eubacteriales bacterium]